MLILNQPVKELTSMIFKLRLNGRQTNEKPHRCVCDTQKKKTEKKNNKKPGDEATRFLKCLIIDLFDQFPFHQ